ncbi:MAG TPA: lipid-binding SYLF domain-containing protein [Woeseiaceae bacterium]|nr:lipid-binding SYLF domain-containing protein [Woeseiaceae bacterium]
MAVTRTMLSLLLIVLLPLAHAATREEQRVADASDVLDAFVNIPEQAIPPSILQRAHGVAVIPNVVKLGFGLGARHGRGILVVRQADGSWSNPAFIALSGGSIGWQIGAQSTDVILVFKTQKGIDGISNGKFTLGADASIAAGPVGRQASAATDLRFEAEVISYSRNRGLFAGVALDGSAVTMDRKANVAYYGDPSMTPEQIFKSSPNIAPNEANRFVQLLAAHTAQLPASRGQSQPGNPLAPKAASEPDTPEVVTYGIPDPDDPNPGKQ